MNWKKITLYVLLSFGISWAVALAMVLAGVHYGSISSMFIIAGLYMPGPALATFLIQKFIYKEPFKQNGWTFDKKALKWYLAPPLFFLGLVLLTFIVIFILGNSYSASHFGQLNFSPESFNSNFRKFIEGKIDVANFEIPVLEPRLFLILALFQGVIGGSTVSLPFMFGEEFGWRGFLLRETQKLGFYKANLFIGTIWGLWHLPVILMGHNYPHYPYIGALMMCLFTISISPLFAYTRLKTKSILGPCMLHGMINTSGILFSLYVVNGNELFSSIAGIAGVFSCAMISTAIILFDKQFVAKYTTAE